MPLFEFNGKLSMALLVSIMILISSCSSVDLTTGEGIFKHRFSDTTMKPRQKILNVAPSSTNFEYSQFDKLLKSIDHLNKHKSAQWVNSQKSKYSESQTLKFLGLHAIISQLGASYSTILSSLFTSSASLIIFVVIWVIQRQNLLTTDILNSLLSFSCGALLGDVFLHIIPAIDHNSATSLLILAGLLSFYILDRIFSKVEHQKSNNKNQGNTILLFLSDFLHNITDGMAIGACYAVDTSLGITTTFAIFFHELAHEIGDFVILLGFGMNLRQTLLMNVATGLGSLFGGIITVNYGAYEDLKRVVLPLVIGNFIYVSMVSMLSSMRSHPKKLLPLELVFFAFGVYLMIIID